MAIPIGASLPVALDGNAVDVLAPVRSPVGERRCRESAHVYFMEASDAADYVQLIVLRTIGSAPKL